jgi:ribosomal protein L11 methylase PrmA
MTGGTMRTASLRAFTSLIAVLAFASFGAHAQTAPKAESVAPTVPTPTSIVDEIMTLAAVDRDDYVIDLGSGDGRIVIAAVARYHARGGLGVDIDKQSVAISKENAVKAGVADRVKFYERDLFDTDVSEATVVTVYLLPSIMGKVEKKLRAELKPGTRVVVHDFPFPDWQPEKAIMVESLDKIQVTGFALSQLYLYRVPERR